MSQTTLMLSEPTRRALRDLAAIDPQDPGCPPDWRARRARIGLAADLSIGKISDGDAMLVAYVHFLTKRARAEEEGTLDALKRKNPEMYAAVSLGGKTGIESARIQAMVLAGTPRGEIAQRAGYEKKPKAGPQAQAEEPKDGQTEEQAPPLPSLGEKIIGLYEDLFFDVRDRLDNRGFITGQVLRMADGCSLPAETFVLGLGWYGGLSGSGLKLLDSYEAIDPNNQKLLNDYAKAFRVKCLLHANITADHARVSDIVRTQLYETQIQKIEQEIRVGAPNEAETTINNKLSNMMAGIKLSVTDVAAVPGRAVALRAVHQQMAAMEEAVNARRGLVP